MEELLYYIWTHRLFALTPLKTTDGLSLSIIDTGLRNRDAGPDFFNAKVLIDAVVWAGNVEMHSKASDWYKHKHHLNKAYDSIILHVVGVADRDTYRTTGEKIPQLVLPLLDHYKSRLEILSAESVQPRCYASLSTLSKLTIHSWLSALLIERLESKSAKILALLKRSEYQWQDVFFIILARNFGFGLNGDVFERWAMQLPFRALDKHRDSLFQLESLFFGISGLLEGAFNDAYVVDLQKEYTYLKTKFSIGHVEFAWKLAKLRPGNFPHLRIAQLAMLYHRGSVLISSILSAESKNDLYRHFELSQSCYWDTHYLFDKESAKSNHSMGKKTIDLLLINTIIPFTYSLGKLRDDEALIEKALSLLLEIKPENNYITKLWDHWGISVDSAGDSQALIQLQKEYCDKKRCLYCRIAYHYLTSKPNH